MLEELLPVKLTVSPDNWIKIQEKLFSMGYEWSSSETKILTGISPYIFLNSRKKITLSNNYDYFESHKYKLIKETDIL